MYDTIWYIYVTSVTERTFIKPTYTFGYNGNKKRDQKCRDRLPRGWNVPSSLSFGQETSYEEIIVIFFKSNERGFPFFIGKEHDFLCSMSLSFLLVYKLFLYKEGQG